MNTKIENVKGVNLGNWLVLEKWMSPELFEGTDAEDEFYLPTKLSKEVYEARIRTHRNEYITERDFQILKGMGINVVRIPLPYFFFGDRAPFIGCVEWMDKAFNWAETYGLQILLDLHTAPDGQNGFDNGGICGICCWCKEPEEVEFVYTVLERLAERYGTRKGLFGIEILNEPVLEEVWPHMHIQDRYDPIDKEKAAMSTGIPMAFLRDFYEKAYDRIRAILPKEKYVVFHDAFMIDAWKDFMRDDKYENVILDTHLYMMMLSEEDRKDPENACRKVTAHWKEQITEMQQYFPVVVGEWCISNPMVHGMSDPEEIKEAYRKVSLMETDAWKAGSGYFYWSYKLNFDTVNGGIPHDSGWDFGRSNALGWFCEAE